MENENKLFGNLFNRIDLQTEDHLDSILDTMDKNHALVYLIEAVRHAYDKNCFTIGETEVLSKSIRVLLK